MGEPICGMLRTKEHHDLMLSFEAEHRHCRLTREVERDRWAKGSIYQDGHVNELFLAYRKGYALGKAVGVESTAAELEALRKDADRYRGLRDNPDVDPGHLLFWQTEEDRALIDEKIDAALNQGGK